MLIALYIITAMNVLVAAGFAVAGIVKPEAVVPGPSTLPSRIFALYAAARTLPLAIVVFIAMAAGAIVVVEWLAALAGVVQLADAVIGARQRDAGKTFGPLVIAVLQFLALALVLAGR